MIGLLLAAVAGYLVYFAMQDTETRGGVVFFKPEARDRIIQALGSASIEPIGTRGSAIVFRVTKLDVSKAPASGIVSAAKVTGSTVGASVNILDVIASPNVGEAQILACPPGASLESFSHGTGFAVLHHPTENV